MSIDEFFEEITKIRGKAIKQKKGGYNNVVVRHIIVGLKFRKKKKVASHHLFFQLVEGYSTAFSLVGQISFDEKIKENDEYYFIGYSYIDVIAVSRKNMEVVTIDPYNPGKVCLYCAKDFECFLKAYLINGIGDFENDFKRKEDMWAFYLERAIRAAEAAGGKKYLAYWKSIFPCESPYDDNPNRGGFYN